MNGNDGPMKRKRDAVVRSPLDAGAKVNDRYTLASCRSQRVLVGVAPVALAAVGDFGDAQMAQHRRKAAGVVAVRMREQDGVDRVDAVPQKKWNDGPFADALGDRIVALPPAFQPATGIDEERVTSRRLNDDCVGLSDIEHGDAKTRVNAARR